MFGVVLINEDPNVEVLGGSGMSVGCEGISADYEKFDLTSYAALDELDEVFVEDVRRSNLD